MTQTAKTYGDSLYLLAKEEGVDILPQLTQVEEILGENPQFLTLLALPSVPKAERTGLVAEAFSGKVHPYVLHFLQILTENGTVGQFSGCVEQFKRRYNEDQGIVEATAVTAQELSPDLMAKLQEKLEQTTGKQVILCQKIDKSVLGGLRLELDGQMLDGTIQNRLATLRTQLKALTL